MPAELKEKITIIVGSKGTRTVRRDLRGIGGDSRSAANGVGALKAALFAIAGGATIRTYSRLSDSFIQIQNRLGLVSQGAQGLNLVFKELTDVSNRSRSSIEANAEVYTRLALSAKDLGLAQSDVLKITESLNQAIILSGATAQEARNGIIQLAQGFASNRLSGDELRAVLEQLPLVADVIAKKMGVVRGALRFLGERGKISADTIAEAFLEAREELAERFAKTIPTIAQSLNVFKNQFVVFAGELSDGQNLISKGIMFLAQNFDIFGRVILAGVVVGALFAVKAAMVSLYVIIVSNPIGVLLTGLAAAVSMLVIFSDKIKLSSDSLATLQDLGIAIFGEFKSVLQDFGTVIAETFGVFGTSIKSLNDSKIDLRDFILALGSFADNFVGVFVGMVTSLKGFAFVFKSILGRIEIGIINTAAAIKQGLAGNTEEASRFMKDAIFQFGQIDNEALKIGKEIGKAFTEGFESTTGVEDVLKRAFVKADTAANIKEVNRLRKERGMEGKDFLGAPPAGASLAGAKTLQDIAFETVKERIDRENALIKENIGVTNLQLTAKKEVLKIEEELRRSSVVLNETQRANLLAAVEENQALEATVTVLKELSGQAQEAGFKIVQLNKLFTSGKINVEEYRMAYRKLRLEELETATDVASGFERGWLRMQETMSDFASVAEDTLVNAFNSAEDALVGFLTTGQINFSAFVDSILSDLARLLARQALMALIKSLGGAEGNLGGTLMGLGERQAGGPVASGRPYVVGEKGPEIFVPGSHGRVEPNNVLNKVAQPAPVSVSVINLTDPNEIPAALNTPAGEQAIINVVRRNRRSIAQGLS